MPHLLRKVICSIKGHRPMVLVSRRIVYRNHNGGKPVFLYKCPCGIGWYALKHGKKRAKMKEVHEYLGRVGAE